MRIYAHALGTKQLIQAKSMPAIDPFAADDSSDDGGEADMNPGEEAGLFHLSNVTTEVSYRRIRVFAAAGR